MPPHDTDEETEAQGSGVVLLEPQHPAERLTGHQLQSLCSREPLPWELLVQQLLGLRASQARMAVGPTAGLRFPGVPNMAQALLYHEGPVS